MSSEKFVTSFFFYLNFIFLLYNTVLVLPYIDMSPPQVYMSSQPWVCHFWITYFQRGHSDLQNGLSGEEGARITGASEVSLASRWRRGIMTWVEFPEPHSISLSCLSGFLPNAWNVEFKGHFFYLNWCIPFKHIFIFKAEELVIPRALNLKVWGTKNQLEFVKCTHSYL